MSDVTAARTPSPVVGAVVRRLLGAVAVLWAAVTLTFLALQLIPGNIEDIMAGDVDYPGLREAIREQWNLDEPLPVQYLGYLGGLLTGDLGRSYVQRRDVSQLLGEQIGPTLQLALAAGVIALAAAVLVAVLTSGRNRRLRAFFNGVEVVANSLPVFWFGLLLLMAFSVQLRIFPISGADGLAGLVLPALTLALPTFGLLSQVLRDAMERSLEQPFSTTALSRGISPGRLRISHSLRHGMIPTVTLAGWLIGQLLGGAVITETVFGRPGLGTATMTAVLSKDVPVVMAVVLVVAFIYVVVSTLVDLSYSIIDPRTKASA